jgi:hypothetical protein
MAAEQLIGVDPEPVREMPQRVTRRCAGAALDRGNVRGGVVRLGQSALGEPTFGPQPPQPPADGLS